MISRTAQSAIPLAPIIQAMQQTILKVNIKTKFQALQDLLLASIIFISAPLLMLFYFNYIIIFLSLFGFYFLFFFLPVIILHNNYKKYNDNKDFSILVTLFYNTHRPDVQNSSHF